MGKTVSKILVAACALVVFLAGGPVAAAGAATATDVFRGTATTGVGQPFPVDVDVNPSHWVVRGDGAIGLPYTYLADGTAEGSLPGTFVFEEHGYIYFMNPADPATFAGNSLTSALITLRPRRPGAPVAIAIPYTFGGGTGAVSAVPHGAMRSLSQVIGKSGVLPKGGDLTYGLFQFTDALGTFTGYATPDFRRFAIEITFSVPS